MGKVNTQLNYLCGQCKKFFGSENATKSHARASHPGLRVVIYRQCTEVDMRKESDPSFADLAIEAQIAIYAGLPTDDAWLLGE